MRNLKDNVAVVTGAASGIGREVAIELARKGCHLAISDVNEQGLIETKSLLGQYPVNVKTDLLDISDQVAFESYAQAVIAHFGHVDRVVNNAGRSVADSFVAGTIEDFKMVMDVNFWGTYFGTKAFLPHLLTRPDATIVNVSSVNALIPFPNQSSYNVSKYAIHGMNESLQQELAGTCVKVVTVFPGGVKTNIVNNSKFVRGPKEGMSKEESADLFKKVAMTSAPRAARIIVRGIRRGKKRIKIGPDAYLFDFLKRIAPKFSIWLVGKLAKA